MRELRDQVIVDSILHWAQDDHRPCIVNWKEHMEIVSEAATEQPVLPASLPRTLRLGATTQAGQCLQPFTGF